MSHRIFKENGGIRYILCLHGLLIILLYKLEILQNLFIYQQINQEGLKRHSKYTCRNIFHMIWTPKFLCSKETSSCKFSGMGVWFELLTLAMLTLNYYVTSVVLVYYNGIGIITDWWFYMFFLSIISSDLIFSWRY